mmetsp:Transcript_26165/g.43282  ORF Transcript_26165/g.43282 Transcript_26165/m.43282 type:complete len:369 (+) Transcript_26165:58-1164(+)
MTAVATMSSLEPCLLLALFISPGAAHSSLIRPKPRNAIDSELPEWHGGKAPYVWEPHGNVPCACRNGTDVCDAAQTCLWMSVGCTIGCKECDGGSKGGANPNGKDRCGSGMNATINDPKYRTLNRNVTAGSAEDWTRFNPWRAPGNAPVFDPCGRAGGASHPTPGHGEFTNTTFAKFGDLGSKVLPKYPTGTVWAAGSTVETMQSIRANHGGGYQYRLCPLNSELTEACFQQTPMPFADDSSLMLSNGTMIKLTSTFVSEGTLPVGSTWQMLAIPDTNHVRPGVGPAEAWAFAPPCFEPRYPDQPLGSLSEGRCSGQWMNNITIFDELRVPESLEPGEYVLGLRWDCETSAQIWQSCADVTITAPKKA